MSIKVINILDPMIKDLTIHRHTNKDLWLNYSQDSQRIEKGIHRAD